MVSNSQSEDEEPSADAVKRNALQRSHYAHVINRPDGPGGGRDEPDAADEDAAIKAWTDAVRDAGFVPEPAPIVAPDPRRHLRAFNPADANAKLVEAGVNLFQPQTGGTDRNAAPAMQERWWRRMAEDEAKGWRRRLIADREQP